MDATGIAACRVEQPRHAYNSASWMLMSGAVSMPSMAGSKAASGSLRTRLTKLRGSIAGITFKERLLLLEFCS